MQAMIAIRIDSQHVQTYSSINLCQY